MSSLSLVSLCPQVWDLLSVLLQNVTKMNGICNIYASNPETHCPFDLNIWCFISSYLIVSVDGYCLVHTTSGELLHKVTPTAQWMHPHLVCLTTNGHFIVHYADQKGCLAVFTCNAKQICQHTLNEPTLVSFLPARHLYNPSSEWSTVEPLYSGHPRDMTKCPD